jgi:sarcosine oxidase gamma subunit
MADARVGEAVSFMQVRVDVSGPGAELVLKQVTPGNGKLVASQ